MDISGFLKLDNCLVAFHLIDKKVTLIPNDRIAYIKNEVNEKNVVYGVTNDSREIALIGCRYTRTKLLFRACVVGTCNTGEVTGLGYFDAIYFSGKVINKFVNKEDYFIMGKDSTAILNSMEEEQRWIGESNIYQDFKLKQWEGKVGIDYMVSTSAEIGSKYIRHAIPRFSLKLKKKCRLITFEKLYLAVVDFFAFACFDYNVLFDEIVISRIDDGKYEKIAKVYINKNEESIDTNYDSNCMLKLDQCGGHFGELFGKIAKRRYESAYDNFFIPANYNERRIVTHERFQSCASSFEHEYKTLFPTKKEINKKYRQISDIMLNSLETTEQLVKLCKSTNFTINDYEKIYFAICNGEIERLCAKMSKTSKNSYTKYYNKYKQELVKIDYSLAEIYKNSLNKFYEIIVDVKAKIEVSNGVDKIENNEAGKIFSDMRNSIAHGNPMKISKEHCVLYQLAKIMIYIMILKNANIPDREIKIIIDNIF